jgi:hypothetical protein
VRQHEPVVRLLAAVEWFVINVAEMTDDEDEGWAKELVNC